MEGICCLLGGSWGLESLLQEKEVPWIYSGNIQGIDEWRDKLPA